MSDSDATCEPRMTCARGRPSHFDRERALDAALDLFWHHGYDGVGVTELVRAMGIARPKLYHAFGNKAGLYRQVLKRYCAGLLSAQDIAAAPSAAHAVQALLARGVELATMPEKPPGCMISSGMLTVAPENADLAAELQELRSAARDTLQARVQQDVDSGALPATMDAGTEARFIFAVLQGLSVQAMDGASRAQLTAVAAKAVDAFLPPIPDRRS